MVVTAGVSVDVIMIDPPNFKICSLDSLYGIVVVVFFVFTILSENLLVFELLKHLSEVSDWCVGQFEETLMLWNAAIKKQPHTQSVTLSTCNHWQLTVSLEYKVSG